MHGTCPKGWSIGDAFATVIERVAVISMIPCKYSFETIGMYSANWATG